MNSRRIKGFSELQKFMVPSTLVGAVAVVIFFPLSGFVGADNIPDEELVLFFRDFNTVLSRAE